MGLDDLLKQTTQDDGKEMIYAIGIPLAYFGIGFVSGTWTARWDRKYATYPDPATAFWLSFFCWWVFVPMWWRKQWLRTHTRKDDALIKSWKALSGKATDLAVWWTTSPKERKALLK